MPISIEEAQGHCSTTEWNTVSNSFPPKLESLTPAVLKKQANRVQRFLDKAEKDSDSKERIAVFSEALKRLQAQQPEKEDNAKLQARRAKEQAAKEKAQEERNKRTEVREALLKKEEEKAAKEGDAASEGKDKIAGASAPGDKSRKSAKRTQGRIGTRKV